MRNVSNLVALLVAVSLVSPRMGEAAQPTAAPDKATLLAQHAQAKRDFQTFFGLTAPHYGPSGQFVRRTDMCNALKAAILGAYTSKTLTTNDPTAGIGGAAQHAVAALNPLSDLGKLLRDRGPPKDLAADGNSYAKLTETDQGEARLRKAIVDSPGHLQPADVMRMALKASGGNYVLATLTAHNLLKNIAYIGRADANLYTKELFDVQGDNVVAVAAKLTNLRSDPSAGDVMGPWYHMFGVLFIGSITSRVQSESMADAEQFSRYLINEKLGIKSYSGVDQEKADWDHCAETTMTAIHPVLYGTVTGLSGTWRGSGGGSGTYEIVQSGTAIHWSAQADDGHAWAHDFSGTIQGDTIAGSFQDRPGYGVLQHGNIVVRVVDACHLAFVSSTVPWGTGTWTKGGC
jgi:hypothetical protein